MPTDPERQRAVREGMALLRKWEAEYVRNHDYDPNEPRPQNLAELLALLVAEAREGGYDEALWAEIILRSIGNLDREELLEARHVLSALGYAGISEVLKRLERSAKPRLMIERARRAARQREMIGRFRRWKARHGRRASN